MPWLTKNENEGGSAAAVLCAAKELKEFFFV
jgi:hypothetical protein